MMLTQMLMLNLTKEKKIQFESNLCSDKRSETSDFFFMESYHNHKSFVIKFPAVCKDLILAAAM